MPQSSDTSREKLEFNHVEDLNQCSDGIEKAPDGGLKAWLVVAAASCIMSMSFGMCNSYGVYQTYHEQKYQHVPSNVLPPNLTYISIGHVDTCKDVVSLYSFCGIVVMRNRCPYSAFSTHHWPIIWRTRHFFILVFFFVFGGLGNFIGPIIGGDFIPKGDLSATAGFDKLAIFCGVVCLGSAALLVPIKIADARKSFVKY